ncbi:hypothetical protein E4U59_003133 [Claviceps monticola]|nr:hypothetical protein E4U59_003133 [Claviceps monticola]
MERTVAQRQIKSQGETPPTGPSQPLNKNVFYNLRAFEDIRVVGKRSAVVPRIRKIGNGWSDAIHKGQRDSVNLGAGTVVAKTLLGKRAIPLV